MQSHGMLMRSSNWPSGDQPSPDTFLFKMNIKKFKNDIGEDFYMKRVKEFAINKNVGNALKLCDTCKELEFSHKPGPCTRSEKSESKITTEQLAEIRQEINRDIIAEIIANAKSEDKTGDTDSNDRLADALDKIS